MGCSLGKWRFSDWARTITLGGGYCEFPKVVVWFNQPIPADNRADKWWSNGYDLSKYRWKPCVCCRWLQHVSTYGCPVSTSFLLCGQTQFDRPIDILFLVAGSPGTDLGWANSVYISLGQLRASWCPIDAVRSSKYTGY